MMSLLGVHRVESKETRLRSPRIKIELLLEYLIFFWLAIEQKINFIQGKNHFEKSS